MSRARRIVDHVRSTATDIAIAASAAEHPELAAAIPARRDDPARPWWWRVAPAHLKRSGCHLADVASIHHRWATCVDALAILICLSTAVRCTGMMGAYEPITAARIAIACDGGRPMAAMLAVALPASALLFSLVAAVAMVRLARRSRLMPFSIPHV